MKKVIGAALVTILCSNVNAQQGYVQAGVNFANISNSNDGSTSDNTVLTTFNVGLMGRFDLSKVVDLEAGLKFTGKGAESKNTFANGNYTKSKFTPLYIELPVNVVVKFPIDSRSNIFIDAGPYIAVGVGGKSTYETSFAGVYTKSQSSINFSNDNNGNANSYSQIKRLDYGLNFGAGIALKQIMFKVDYGLGLSKINADQTNNSSNDKNKYRTFSLSLGFPFGGKK